MDSYLVLRILTYDDSSEGLNNPFLIFVQNNSDLPSVKIEHPCNFEAALRNELARHIYNPDLAFNAKHFSTINTTENRVEIYFNFFVNSKNCKDTGSFVKFNKKSMELYRFLNLQGGK